MILMFRHKCGKPFARGLMETSSNNLNARVAFQFKAADILEVSFIVILLHFSVYFNFLQTYAHRNARIGTANTNNEQELPYIKVKL